MKEVWHLDNLIQECGWFTSETTVNNGYGCRHPGQEDLEEEHLETLRHRGVQGPPPFRCGRCFAFTCPIATELNPSEDPEDAEEVRAAGMDPASTSDGEWMLVSVSADGRLEGAA